MHREGATMDKVKPAGAITLGELRLDPAGGTLTRDGRMVDLRAKSFLLLCHLARNAGRVLSKAELMDAVWPDVAVTEDSLTQAIRDIRVTLGPAATALRTVARRGYLLDVGPQEAPPPTPPRLPRIVVRPFAVTALSARDAAMPVLMREEILGGLSRFRSLDVLRGGPDRVAPEDCDQIVDGLVWSDSGGAMLRLTLIDPRNDRVAWSATFTCGAGPGPDEETAQGVTGALHAAIEAEAELRSYRRDTESMTAWELFSRAVSVCYETRADALERAAAALDAAILADPGFGLAYSYRAYVELALHVYLMAPPDVIARVRDLAEHGARLAPDEARAVSTLGYVQSMMGEYDSAEARIAHAYRLNPGSLDVLMERALLCIKRGRPTEALVWLDRAEPVQPRRDAPNLYSSRGYACYHLGRYSEAMAAFLRIADLPVRRQLWVAASAAMDGNSREAQERIALFRVGMPGTDPVEIARRTYTYEHAADSAHLLEGIRRAMALG
jgi:DNA-binding winged helix-turn-helix (wHTH) protein/tetratricopeptide (TPR) repeat protein